MSEHESITAEGLQALKAELEELEGPARADMARRIGAARDEGDLKENAEYHQAKEDQALLETKIQRLQERLRRAQVVEAPADGSKVAFGHTVTITDGSGKERTYTIVGPTEADLKTGKLSSESPVAQAIIGHVEGDAVKVNTPRGPQTYTVVRLGS
ncbi:MAG: transcription elongation factor GreA [Solirubrobacteraceae bacterium]